MELVLNQHKLQISGLNLSEEEYFYPHEIVVAEKKTHFQVGKHFNNMTSTLVLYTESIVVLYSFHSSTKSVQIILQKVMSSIEGAHVINHVLVM